MIMASFEKEKNQIRKGELICPYITNNKVILHKAGDKNRAVKLIIDNKNKKIKLFKINNFF